MRRKGVVFDCDGTLVDSLAQAFESFNHALQAVGEQRRSREAIKRYFGVGADRILIQLVGDEERGLEAFQHYMDHQSELADRTHLHAGVREMLDQLAHANVPMAVVTGRHERDLDVVLAPHKLSDYFVAMIADNHAPNSKPAPDGLQLAAERMGLPPQDCIYVGDAIVDIQAAHAAHSAAVAAVWDSLADAAELEAEKPTYTAQHPLDVITIYQQLSRG